MQEMIGFYSSLGTNDRVILIVSCLLLSTSLARLSWWVSHLSPLPYPSGGHRGAQRRRAEQSGAFAWVEPWLRLLGALVQLALSVCYRRGGSPRSWARNLVTAQRRRLIRAGEPLGLEAHEMLALSCLSLVLGGCLGLFFGRDSGSLLWVGPSAVVLAALPNVRLQALTAARFTEMSRELPASIDLMAMAMSAGSDFPGAVRRVIDGQKGVVADELAQLLTSLDLGITRSSALIALRERVPIAAVHDLVRAILMAEKKGSALSEALSQQAATSRQKRSERAEEVAARAGVLLLFPLMLLMGCVMILLVGPLLSSGIGL